MPARTLVSRRYERQLGETEVSYYLPSRADGVNDMYLHLGFRASPDVVRQDRISLAWAILRIRHPLLACSVEMSDYHDIRFVYETPFSPDEALKKARQSLEFTSVPKDALLDSYLNGPRTLSSQRPSCLILSHVVDSQNAKEVNDYDLLICATHYLGDGMALHQFAHDLFTLLGNSTDDQLDEMLQKEFQTYCDVELDTDSVLPPSLEQRLPLRAKGSVYHAATKVDYKNTQGRLIGGHSLPRKYSPTRHTIVPTVSFDEERTRKILKNCKAHGASISCALFAICSIAWAKTTKSDWHLPIMMYSALNLRPYLSVERPIPNSYWFIAIGYFNVVLPTFLHQTGDIRKNFWHRARMAKEQSTKTAKSPLVVSRSRLMAEERGARARVWAKEDDEKAIGKWRPPPPSPSTQPANIGAQVPSTALMGLSLLGNLDGIYKHDKFPKVQMHTLTTGSRQRAGGLLLFGYTFVGRLWVSLGYDKNGFDKEVIEKFWSNILASIDELL